jgi:hypothetical protein
MHLPAPVFAVLLQLPLPLHLACSVAEWLLIYSTALRLDAAHHHAATSTAAAAAGGLHTFNSSSISWLQPGQLLLSLLCVVLLPTLGVVRLQ